MLLLIQWGMRCLSYNSWKLPSGLSTLLVKSVTVTEPLTVSRLSGLNTEIPTPTLELFAGTVYVLCSKPILRGVRTQLLPSSLLSKQSVKLSHWKTPGMQSPLSHLNSLLLQADRA